MTRQEEWSVLFVFEVGVLLMSCGCGEVGVSFMPCGCGEVGVTVSRCVLREEDLVADVLV